MATTTGTVIGGKYEILREVGRGGMSVVYLALDTRLNKQWAVKEIRKRGVDVNGDVIAQTLITEANMMKRLDHPAIPRIVDIFENDTVIYVVMDYIEGESLDKVLKANGPQPQEVVIDWIKQLADALGYLHKQNPPVIYRDMKPANVMLKPEGTVKMFDFGTAREYKAGTNKGDTVAFVTQGYAAPEQYDRTRQTDARTDIYCLGMTMHHLLTGQDPTSPDYEYKPIRQWDPTLHEGLERIIERCHRADPDDRFQNCDELLYALENYEYDTIEYRKRQRKKLNRFIAAAAACVVFVLVAAGARITGNVVKNNDYEALINQSGDYDVRIEQYQRAMTEIDSSRLDALEELLKAYREEGRFDKKESLQISELAHQYTGPKDVPEYLEFCYDLGYMYINFYTEDGKVGFAPRATRANGYFSEIEQILAEHPNLSFANEIPWRSYYSVTKLLTESNSLTLAQQRSKDDLEVLLDSISSCVEEMRSGEGYSGSDAESIRLSQATYFANQINAMANEFCDSGVSLDHVLSVMQEIRDSEASISLSKLQDNKATALADCDAFIDNIRAAYSD